MDFDVVVQDDELVRIEPLEGGRSISTPEGFMVVEP
jgi:hypothetical protein